MAKLSKKAERKQREREMEVAKRREAERVALAVRVFAWTFDIIDGREKIDCREKCDRLISQLSSAFNVPTAAFAMMMIEMDVFDGRLSLEELDELRNAGLWEATRELCESWRYEWTPSYQKAEAS